MDSRPGFIARLVLRWAEKKQRKEIETFLGILSTLDDNEMSELLLCVSHIRKGMEAQGIAPLEPFQVVLNRPTATVEIAKLSQQFNKNKAFVPAAACTVWGHTFRAALNPALHPQARLMWRELKRGERYLFIAKASLSSNYGINADLEGADLVPGSFEIQP